MTNNILIRNIYFQKNFKLFNFFKLKKKNLILQFLYFNKMKKTLRKYYKILNFTLNFNFLIF